MRPRPLLAAAAVLALAGALFAWIASGIGSGSAGAVLDERLAAWLHARATPALTDALLLVTHLHSNVSILLLALAMAWALHRRGEGTWLATLLLAVPVGLLGNVLLKHAFQRARPSFESPLVELPTYSFPSGHVAGAVLLYGFLVAYGWRRMEGPRERAAAVAGAAVVVALVAFSRLYLGAHYLNDVLASVAWSGGWLALCLTLPHALRRDRREWGAP